MSHRTPLLCRCVTSDGAECNRRATQEDGVCDLCRPLELGPTTVTSADHPPVKASRARVSRCLGNRHAGADWLT